MILSGLVASPLPLVLTFDVVVGTGIGFGYACLSTAAMKWFHPSRKGFVNGVITAGFGLGAVYLAPLTSQLIETQGIQFMWIMFAFASSAGLMVIGNITSLALTQANISDSAYLVGIVAIFNCLGRMGEESRPIRLAGSKPLMVTFVLQGANMLMFGSYSTEVTLIIGAIAAGAGYGILLCVFPSLTAEFFGLKNYGTNYGVLYTAWGISGFIGPVIAAFAVDTSGSYSLAYSASAVMVGIALALAFMTKPVGAAQPEIEQEVVLA